MKKTALIMGIMFMALLGISGPAFAKHHHRKHHKKDTTTAQPANPAAPATGNSAASVTGQTAGAPKTN